jgi:nuclear transcription factor Y, gamma
MGENTEPFVKAGEPLNDFLRSFWRRQVDTAEQETLDYRHPPLPLARIKKVMKSDPEVKVSTWAVFGMLQWILRKDL